MAKASRAYLAFSLSCFVCAVIFGVFLSYAAMALFAVAVFGFVFLATGLLVRVSEVLVDLKSKKYSYEEMERLYNEFVLSKSKPRKKKR